MAKSVPQVDVLVVGDHPAAYLAAALLRQQKRPVAVGHATIPGEEHVDRLVTINPEFFNLLPSLGSMKRKLDLTPIYGLRFLADNPAISSINQGKTIGAYIGEFKQIHGLMAKLAKAEGVSFFRPRGLKIKGVDERGLSVEMDRGMTLRPRLLIVAGELDAEQKRLLGLVAEPGHEVMHRYTFVRLKGSRWHAAGSKPVMPMSLDIGGTLNWAWLMPAAGQVQLAVMQPKATVEQHPPAKLMRKWVEVLVGHGALQNSAAASIDMDDAVEVDLPLGGALLGEQVANRTLLIGPAGGFYTACAEDIYPNCWSAIHAAEVAQKALTEPHLQDALQPFRQRWGSTLGDYLRGPQQNLRFLLPLVYRNPTMTARLTEAILSGKSVVR